MLYIGALNQTSQESLLYLDGSSVFSYAALQNARKMKAGVLTSRMEVLPFSQSELGATRYTADGSAK